jgi:nucleoside-diphosphate-sugar epimerase
MTVLITGGSGFLGHRLAETILASGALPDHAGRPIPVTRVRLLDRTPSPLASDARVESIVGDVADEACIRSAIGRDTTSIFHLAAVVSGEAEADFDLGMRVNLDGTRRILDACRALGHAPKVVFASSVAVYGGEVPETIQEQTRLTPQSSYGTEKAIGELLVNDYSRRGFVDGRALRLPTISVRPGRPNAALSSFASGIIREPLNGQVSICPVGPDTVMWLLSPATMTRAFLVAHGLPAARLGTTRSIIVPGLSIEVGEMVRALARVAGADVASLVRWEPDARVLAIAGTWPGRFDASRALALGFPVDASFDDIIRQYIANDLPRTRGGQAAAATR